VFIIASTRSGKQNLHLDRSLAKGEVVEQIRLVLLLRRHLHHLPYRYYFDGLVLLHQRRYDSLSMAEVPFEFCLEELERIQRSCES